MVLNDLFKLPELCKGIETFLSIEHSNAAENVKQTMMVIYRLDEYNMNRLIDCYREKYRADKHVRRPIIKR